MTLGSVYQKRGKLWLAFVDVDGKRKGRPTGLVAGEEEKARRMLALLEAKVAALKAAGEEVPGTLTVQRWCETWVDRRKGSTKGWENEEGHLRRHVYPALGAVALADLRQHHVRDLVRELKRKASVRGGVLSPRTVRHVYGTLHAVLQEAVVDELLPANPCVLRRGELPAKEDKVPGWREQAVYTRAEVEQLLSDDRIPDDRRVYNALLLLTGARPGEIAALRWRDYDPDAKPLGRLALTKAWDSRRHREKAVKTERPRSAPVHPTLARVLASWKLTGWAGTFGKAPEPDDLVIPARSGKPRDVNHARESMHLDQRNLGWRKRRLYDTRSTFISLAQTDGGRKDILRWVTHGPDGSIFDAYTRLPWSALCDEVAKLNVRELGAAEVRQLRAVAGQRPVPEGGEPATLAPCATPAATTQLPAEALPGNPSADATLSAKKLWGLRESFDSNDVESREVSSVTTRKGKGEASGNAVSSSPAPASGSAVADAGDEPPAAGRSESLRTSEAPRLSPPAPLKPAQAAQQASAAVAEVLATGDLDVFRARLEALVSALKG